MAEAPIANLVGSNQLAGSKVPQHVLVIDGSGNPVTFGGSGGTSETDSASFTATVTLGTPAMGAFETTPDTLTSGQLGILALDTNRNLKVNVAAGGTSGTQYTQGDTDASVTGTAAMMEAAADTLVPLQGTVADGLLVNLGSNNDVTVGGTVTVTGDSGGSLTVDAPVGTPVFVRLSDGSSAIATLPVSLAAVPSHAVTNAGTFATQVDGAALTALQLIDNIVMLEDAAHASGDPGVQALTVRSDTAAALAGTDGDYQPLITDGSGRLHVNVGNTVTVGSHAVTNAGTFAVQESGGALTALQAIDDWDESDRAKVNPIVGQAGVAAGAGASGATTQRVILATDGQPGAGTFATNQVSVTTTATLIVAARSGRRSAGIMQHGTTAVLLGPTSGVTTSNGLLLPGTAGAGVTLDYSGDIYGIVASGTQTVSYGEEY